MLEQNISIRERNGWLWFDFPDTLNAHTAHSLEDALGKALADTTRIVVDMAQVRFLYSTAIGFLVRLHKRIAASQGQLCLVNVAPAVRAIFASINLDKVLAIYATDTEFEISTDFWQTGALTGAPPFSAIPQVQGDLCRVTLCGYMTPTNTTELLAAAQINAGVRFYLFDITGLQTVDCGVLDSLVDFLRQLHHRGVYAAVFGAGEAVAPLCSLIALQEALPVFASEQQALEALRSMPLA